MSELEDNLNKILSSPEDMEKIMGIARSLSGSAGGTPSGEASPAGESAGSADGAAAPPLDLASLSSALGKIDPKLFRLVSRVLSEYGSTSNDKAALLSAIKPYLKEDRRAKMDKAVEIAKYARLAKAAFAEFTGGDKNV